MPGTLYICATPIGNREDISARCLDTLRQADLIAAEDTRHSQRLLSYYDIHKPLISYHEHNKYERAEELIARLVAGENIALISDAGTPIISDPGEVLVMRAHQAGIRVTALPGPCALITALSLSGISARRFVFEGFLPLENKERQSILQALSREERTIILYEAPHRLIKTLQDLEEHMGEQRSVCLCRELTKIHEEVRIASLGEAIAEASLTPPRGEYVLIISGKSRQEVESERKERWDAQSPQAHLSDYMGRGLSKKEAMKQMSQDFGISRNELYDMLMKKPEA